MLKKIKKKPNSKRRNEEKKKLSSLSLGELLSHNYKRREKEARKRRNCFHWSELPPDLIHSVLERLSIRDLQRAKSVCSAWLSASKKCAPTSQVPWLILFPNDKKNGCKLFNPEEKDKLYNTSHDLGDGVCVATYGCWLLMRNPLFNLYIVNLLTGQRINLPPVESQQNCKTKFERIVDDKFRATQLFGSEYRQAHSVGFEINSPRLWVDEEARDYLVIFSLRMFMWSFWTQYTIVCKKGDHLWRQLPDCSPCSDMVYKHHKLYLYRHGTIQILDLSGELPLIAPETHHPDVAKFSFNDSHIHVCGGPFTVKKTNIVVTVSGHVLMAVSVMTSGKTLSFRIYKMSSWTNNWERLVSLGGEAMLLDLGVTVPAKDIEGINENSIYFSGLGQDENDHVFIFNLKTKKIERPHQSVCSFLQYSRARWFLPGFSHKLA